MKILQCHNMYQMPGGEDSVVQDERALLESRGHTVIPFVLHNDDVPKRSTLRLAAETIWSRESAAKLRDLCRAEKPDIAHFHNTLPLMSPAAYYAVRGEGVPVVQTLHNYRLLCPKATFFRDNQVCQDCLHKRIKLPAIRHACYRDSRAATAAVVTMLTVHGLLGTYRRQVDAYIACSEFTRDKMIEGGYEGNRIHYKPNFMAEDVVPGDGSGGYPLYLGRLSPEKGVEVLVAAWKLMPEVPLHIVGKGPQEKLVDDLIATRSNIFHESWVKTPTLGKRIGEAAFLVLPTMNFEGFPRVIVEAYAHGVPVVASNLGAMGKVVVDGVTGRHIKYGDAADLARVVRELMSDPAQVQRLRQGARAAYEKNYTAAANYEGLMRIYAAAQQHFRGEATSPAPAPTPAPHPIKARRAVGVSS